ncbi:MAG: GNAT family N-acetyltransferase [Syntrophomonadaceae bacterium]|jgi:ribosomal protein S18 acetylase RimI-like enzyme|nr:GNAT family N-acetyltransferase [Syntrophomonadaceae bacterium]
MITISVAAADYATSVALFAREVWVEYYSPFLGFEPIDYMLNKFQSAEQISRDIKRGYTYYVAHDENRLVGYCAARLDEHSLFLSKLYIERSYRKQGLARKFFELLLQMAREHDKSYIWLNVNKQNEAIALYKHLGFVVTDAKVTDIGEGFIMDDYIMEYPI